MRANVLAQPVGLATVGELGLSESLIGLIVDRVIRSSFEERYRAVFSDRGDGATPAMTGVAALSNARGEGAAVPEGGCDVERIDVALAADDPLRDQAEGRPGCRAFRTELDESRSPVVAIAPDALPTEQAGRTLAEHVARRLAGDGLIPTLVHAIRTLGASRFVGASETHLSELAVLGIPVDLLEHFDVTATASRGGANAGAGAHRSDDEREADGSASLLVIRHVAASVLAAAGDSEASSSYRGDDLVFRFRRTDPRFVPLDDAGGHEPTLLRGQMTRGGHWLGPNSGDNLDLLRHVAEATPGTPMIITIGAGFAEEFVREHASRWKRPEGRLTVLSVPAMVSQWAQDNARAGTLAPPPPPPTDGLDRVSITSGPTRPARAVLAPRYPSRGDDGSVFVPGEGVCVRALQRAGFVVRQSPLLFQGGNLLVCPDPKEPGSTMLLVGESDVARNVGLGLSIEQSLEALRREFAASRAVVLPGVSYHIDYEVSVRAVVSEDGGKRVTAFVIDSRAGVRHVLSAAIDCVEEARMLPKPRLKAARQHLASEKWIELLELFYSAVLPQGYNAAGQLTESFAGRFVRASGESGVANLHRVLLAMDMAASWVSTPWEASMHPHARAYLRALRRRDAERGRLHEILRETGFVVVAVPGFAEGDRSRCPLNGVQLPRQYLMPAARGGVGLFQLLDEAAAAVLAGGMGPECPITCIPALESECRNGGVHCSIAAD